MQKLKTTIIFLIVFFGVLGLAESSLAANWYVLPSEGCTYNGNGASPSCASGSGQQGAWKGFSNIIWGTKGVTAGDTLYLIGGETYTGTISVGASGSSENWITITVYGEDSAVMDIENNDVVPIYLGSRDYIKIDGVRGHAEAGDYTYGLRMINMVRYGVYQNDSSLPGHLKILHVEFAGTGTPSGASDDQSPIRLTSLADNVEIGYNWIYDTKSGDDRWVVSGIVVYRKTSDTAFDHVKIHHNKVERLFHDGIKIIGYNGSIYNNHTKDINYSGHSDSLLIQGGGYGRIYNNYVEGSDQKIYLNTWGVATHPYIYIYNNVINIYNTGGFGFVPHPQYDDGANYQYIYLLCNTFSGVNSGTGPMVRQGSHTVQHIYNTTFKNNYFGPPRLNSYRHIENSLDQSDFDELDYNCYGEGGDDYPDLVNFRAADGGNHTLAELQADGMEIHGLVGTATFEDAVGGDFYPVAADAMLIGKGENLYNFQDVNGEYILRTDKDGNPRPSLGAWTIGAYEYVGAAPPDTTPPTPPTGVGVN